MSKNIAKKISKNSVKKYCLTLKDKMERELIDIVMKEFKRQIKDDTIHRAAVLGPTDNSLEVWLLCLLGYKRPYKVTVFVNAEVIAIEYIEH